MLYIAQSIMLLDFAARVTVVVWTIQMRARFKSAVAWRLIMAFAALMLINRITGVAAVHFESDWLMATHVVLIPALVSTTLCLGLALHLSSLGLLFNGHDQR
jgi:hypothetical protein